MAFVRDARARSTESSSFVSTSSTVMLLRVQVRTESIGVRELRCQLALRRVPYFSIALIPGRFSLAVIYWKAARPALA